MTIEEFFKRYANLPLAKRFIPLNFAEHGMMTLQDINSRLHALEDQMRPMRIERDRLIKIAENFV